MNIRQLEAFRAIMIARSTIGAAELLEISQPAISRLLSQLEQSLGLTLFDRSSGRLVPTFEANLLYSEVERTFVSVNNIREMARDIRSANWEPSASRRCRYLAWASFPRSSGSLTPCIRAPASRSTCRCRLRWKTGRRPSRSISVSPNIRSRPGRSSGRESEVRRLSNVPLLLAVPTGHRLARHVVVRPQDLAGERFISQTLDTVGRHKVDRLFAKEGVARHMVLETVVAAVVAKFVAQGLGVGFIDPFTAVDFADNGIATIPFEPAIDLRLGMLHPTHRPLSRIAGKFAALIRSCRRNLLNNEGGRRSPA